MKCLLLVASVYDAFFTTHMNTLACIDTMFFCLSCILNTSCIALCNNLFIVQYNNTFTEFIPLTPNDDYSGRTAPLTSKRCILYIYSTNIRNEYFKHGIYSPFFPLKMQLVS